MKRILAAALAALAAAACSDSPLGTSPLALPSAPAATRAIGDVVVTNSNDAGPGSFRDAIAQANGNAAIGSIGFHPSVTTIALQSGIVFTGTQDLVIHANRATLDASAAGGTAFLANGGGDLELIGLTVRNASGEGVAVEVPVGATGTQLVVMRRVEIRDNAGHGLLVDDQASNTSASVDVRIHGSRFLGNGNVAGLSVSDRDGVRVNEGGDGDIFFTFRDSRTEGNGADGIELDETGDGNVQIDVANATIIRNGPFDPADLDDGFDVDEAGIGSILGTVEKTTASHNFEEGLDFNENDVGDLRVDLTDVQASFNGEEGVDYEEDDDFGNQGDIVATMTRVRTFGNKAGDGGLKIREKQAGNLAVTLVDVMANFNLTSGIFVRESGSGSAAASLTSVVATGNKAVDGNGDGIELEGSWSTPSITNATVSANEGYGIRADAGTVTLTQVKGGANGAGLTGGGATFVKAP